MDSLTSGDVPPGLAAATKNVWITRQDNIADVKWAIEYNMPGFQSVATGGKGTIVVYHDTTMTQGVFTHEAGHNLAWAEWGSPHPPPYSFYGGAQKHEPPVTNYAKNAPAEDFAEACRLYCDTKTGGRNSLKTLYPRKYYELEKLFEKHDPKNPTPGQWRPAVAFKPPAGTVDWDQVGNTEWESLTGNANPKGCNQHTGPDCMTGYHAETKGGFAGGKPSIEVGSDYDIMGKGFYFGTEEYAGRYGEAKPHKIKGKLATGGQWMAALAKHQKKRTDKQRAAAREELKEKGYVGVWTGQVGVVWDQSALEE